MGLGPTNPMLGWSLAQPSLTSKSVGPSPTKLFITGYNYVEKTKKKKDFHLEQLIFFLYRFFYVFPIIYLAREKQDFSYLNIYEKYPTLSIHCFYFISI